MNVNKLFCYCCNSTTCNNRNSGRLESKFVLKWFFEVKTHWLFNINCIANVKDHNSVWKIDKAVAMWTNCFFISIKCRKRSAEQASNDPKHFPKVVSAAVTYAEMSLRFRCVSFRHSALKICSVQLSATSPIESNRAQQVSLSATFFFEELFIWEFLQRQLTVNELFVSLGLL